MSFGAEDDADADADADGFRNGCNESDSDVGKSEDEYDGGYMDMGIEGVGGHNWKINIIDYFLCFRAFRSF